MGNRWNLVSKTPAALLDLAIEAVWATLRIARPDEIDELSWRSPLAERIGQAVCVALPYESTAKDAKNASLLLAASNACQSGVSISLDVGLAIAARALYRRILRIEATTPIDVLTRFDVLLVFLREGWIMDNEDLIWFVSQLRRYFVSFALSSTTPTPERPHQPDDPYNDKRLVVLELIRKNTTENAAPA